MKNSVLIVIFILLLQACSTDIRDQVEGIIWTDNYSKLGGSQAYTSFIDGKVLSCSESEKKWLIIALYEINGNSLTISPKAKSKEMKSFNISVKGNSDKKVLTMSSGAGENQREMTFPASTSNACPLS